MFTRHSVMPRYVFLLAHKKRRSPPSSSFSVERIYAAEKREKRKNEEIEDSLSLLKRKIDQINLMVDGVGKKLLAEIGE